LEYSYSFRDNYKKLSNQVVAVCINFQTWYFKSFVQPRGCIVNLQFAIKEGVKRTALLWVITQGVMVIFYRRFGTTYQSHLQGSRSLKSHRGVNSKCWLLVG